MKAISSTRKFVLGDSETQVEVSFDVEDRPIAVKIDAKIGYWFPVEMWPEIREAVDALTQASAAGAGAQG